jgi:hypothetical protein
VKWLVDERGGVVEVDQLKTYIADQYQRLFSHKQEVTLKR